MNGRQGFGGVLFDCSAVCFTLLTKHRNACGNGFPSKEIPLNS